MGFLEAPGGAALGDFLGAGVDFAGVDVLIGFDLAAFEDEGFSFLIEATDAVF